MPANIAVTNGRYNAMYADTPAWHRLGEVVAGARTAEEAQKIAGTDFDVALAPVFAEIDGRMVELETHRSTYRTDTGAPLGVVSKDYRVIQNLTPMQMLEAIVKTNEAGIVAHAALGRGERLFAVLELSRLTDIVIPTDPSKQYGFLVAQWWHDATGALSIGPYMQRVECQNMANAQLSWGDARGLNVRISHVGDVGQALEEAQRVLGFAERSISQFVDVMSQLADTPTPPDPWLGEFLERLIPIPADMERPVARVEARAAIASLYADSKTLVGVPKSVYRLKQAVDEYADHWRPLRIADPNGVPEKRFKQIVGGPAGELKDQAMKLIREEFEVRTPQLSAFRAE